MEFIDKSLLIAIVGILASIASIFLFGNKLLYTKYQTSFGKTFIRFIPLVAVITTISVYLFFDKKIEVNPTKDNNHQINLDNSIDGYKQKEMELKRRTDSLSQFVLEFLKAEKTDSSNIVKYYASNLEVYYQHKNSSLNYILQNRHRFIKAYPKSKFYFDKFGIDVNIIGEDTADVTVSGLFYPDSSEAPKQILYKIKIDMTQKKIF
jgi:hypothetical protein